MKKIMFSIAVVILIVGRSVAQTTVDLNGVTFGFGAGPAASLQQTYDYALSTDAAHNLQLQSLSRETFVISSVLMVKLGKLSVDPNSSTLVPQSQKTKYAAAKKANSESGSSYAGFSDRLSINLALNLADVSSNVTFNKSINGGIGLGYFVTDNLQLALFYDVSQLSQLRDYVVNAYQGKPIPNGTGTYYNSISTTDSNLFYNKTVSGLSFKLIFSIGNQKAPAAAPGG